MNMFTRNHAWGAAFALCLAGLAGFGYSSTSAAHDPAPVFSYLRMNGTFEMDPVHAATRSDPRNPSRVKLVTTDKAGTESRFTFYAHNNPNAVLAECGYQYVGSRPDPQHFPKASKMSVWDIFEQTRAYAGRCKDFAVVAARSPHGEPIHMHLRYGANANDVLNMSLAREDKARFNPWWSVYCAPGRTTTCD